MSVEEDENENELSLYQVRSRERFAAESLLLHVSSKARKIRVQSTSG